MEQTGVDDLVYKNGFSFVLVPKKVIFYNVEF